MGMVGLFFSFSFSFIFLFRGVDLFSWVLVFHCGWLAGDDRSSLSSKYIHT